MRRAARAALTAALAAALVSPGGAVAAKRVRPPVVMLVLDEFPTGSIQRPDGRLDAARFPGFASLARDSVWFPNAHATHDTTSHSVPSILTGVLTRPGDTIDYRGRPRSVFTHLDRLGYRITSFEPSTEICPPRICPRVNGYGRLLRNLVGGHRERLTRFLTAAGRARSGRFVFHHAFLPHGPWRFRPSGIEAVSLHTLPIDLPRFASGYHSAALTDFNRQSHLLQVGYVDSVVGKLVSRLKRSGQWRRALVIVTADHGIWFGGGTDRRELTHESAHAVAPVPLFVKRPGSTRGAVSRSYIRGTDVLPTIARLLRFKAPGTDGASAFSAAAGRRPGIRMLSRRDFKLVRFPAGMITRARAEERARQAGRFGTGSWSRLFAIGPGRHLHGQMAADHLSGATAGVRALLAYPSGGLANVDLGARALPVILGGHMEGGAPGSVRDVVVAVNGRIAASTTTFRLTDSPGHERFVVNIRPSDLAQGRNRVTVYELGRGGLTALGSL